MQNIHAYILKLLSEYFDKYKQFDLSKKCNNFIVTKFIQLIDNIYKLLDKYFDIISNKENIKNVSRIIN